MEKNKTKQVFLFKMYTVERALLVNVKGRRKEREQAQQTKIIRELPYVIYVITMGYFNANILIY